MGAEDTNGMTDLQQQYKDKIKEQIAKVCMPVIGPWHVWKAFAGYSALVLLCGGRHMRVHDLRTVH